MKSITKCVRDAIISLLKKGISTREVCKKYAISQSSVQRIRSKYCSDISGPSAGRPKILSAQNKRSLARFITSGVAKSAVMAGKLIENVGVRCSRWTIRRALKEMNFKAIEKKKKPMISKKNIKARLAFAKKYMHWTVDDWKRVIWSDESKINRILSDGRQWAWIRKGESLQRRHVQETIKFGGGFVMLWGCFTVYGLGSLSRISGRMNQYMYQEILNTKLRETVENMPIHERNIVFQHDRDPKHMANSVQNWLQLQPFQVLDWPAQSPDLNPIENLWAILKRQIRDEYDSPPRNLNELWERVEQQWYAIPQEICTNLVESMPRRIAAVLSAKGLWTKY